MKQIIIHIHSVSSCLGINATAMLLLLIIFSLLIRSRRSVDKDESATGEGKYLEIIYT